MESGERAAEGRWRDRVRVGRLTVSTALTLLAAPCLHLVLTGLADRVAGGGNDSGRE